MFYVFIFLMNLEALFQKINCKILNIILVAQNQEFLIWSEMNNDKYEFLLAESQSKVIYHHLIAI